MTHSPPVPPGNQSPYPLNEPPHAHAGPPPSAQIAKTPEPRSSDSDGVKLGAGAIGAIVGIGAMAFAAGAYLFRDKVHAKPKRAKGKGKRGGKGSAKK